MFTWKASTPKIRSIQLARNSRRIKRQASNEKTPATWVVASTQVRWIGIFWECILHPDQPRVYGRMRALHESLLEYVMFKSSNSNEPAITTYLYVGNHAMSCRLVVIPSPLCILCGSWFPAHQTLTWSPELVSGGQEGAKANPSTSPYVDDI